MNYAALMAARAGAVSHINVSAMKMAAVRGLRPILSDADLAAYEAGDISDIPVEVIIINPNIRSFLRYSDLSATCDGGILCIPNTYIRERGDTAIGNDTLADANLLRIELLYNYPLVVPIAGNLLAVVSASPGGNMLVGCGEFCPEPAARMPVQGVATVRMQSVPKLTLSNFPSMVWADCVEAKINDTEPLLGGDLCPVVDFL